MDLAGRDARHRMGRPGHRHRRPRRPHRPPPNELSGGQQQRVAVSRALATRPQIIFADEPTGNLDSTTGQRDPRASCASAVDEFGQTIVMVTHDPVAASYADRVMFLVDGKIVAELADPTPDAVLDQMKRTGRLIDAAPHDQEPPRQEAPLRAHDRSPSCSASPWSWRCSPSPTRCDRASRAGRPTSPVGLRPHRPHHPDRRRGLRPSRPVPHELDTT